MQGLDIFAKSPPPLTNVSCEPTVYKILNAEFMHGSVRKLANSEYRENGALRLGEKPVQMEMLSLNSTKKDQARDKEMTESYPSLCYRL